MNIKIIEPGGFKHDGQQYDHSEVRNVDQKLGEYFCAAGWAEDTSGVVETATRDVNKQVALQIDDSVVTQTAESIGE